MAAVQFGTLGTKWGCWSPSSSGPCKDHTNCGTLHAGVADIMVVGECPCHQRSKIRLNGLKLGDSQARGDNFMEQEMLCGDFPVGLTEIWCNLKTPGVLAFTLVRRCMNPE
mmetsp:Transcript_91237/g.261120  ORF Transcript_91237/g.261120 Transcript_91237/m.261120 type:complete len:111 (+) Transcript_91237:53-385(+)